MVLASLGAIPGQCLAQAVTDSDQDGLPDAWETAHFGNLEQGPLGDPDSDRWANILESQANGDPNAADFAARPGVLYAERWNQINGFTVDDLTDSAHFHDLPDEVSFVGSAELTTASGDYYGIRLRGCVIAPASGTYRFYIASDDCSQLWLGTSASKFSKRMVASVSSYTGARQWTRYPSQKSVEIKLVAGQKYYFEALMKEAYGADHLAVGWTYTDDTGVTAGQSAVAVIPGYLADANTTQVLEGYKPDPKDKDDDGLPDSWEISVGLNPGDNGGIHAADGGYADADNDGFNNFEEYVTGGDPFKAGGNRGYVLRDIWTGINGNSVSSLTSSPNMPKPANFSAYVSSALKFGTYADNYGQRLTGSIVPPRAGNWRFWISADAAAELWLSDSWKSTGKRKAAFLSSFVAEDSFDTTPSQMSTLKSLAAGTPYYFEVLHKDDVSIDHLAVAWAYDSPNWALAANGSSASQGVGSSTPASRAIDGNTSGEISANSISQTTDAPNSWWQVNFGQLRPLNRVVLWNRTDAGFASGLSNFRISVLDAAGAEIIGQNFFPPGSGHVVTSLVWDLPQVFQAEKVRVSLLGSNNAGNGILALAEVQSFEWYPESVRQIVPASALRTRTLDPEDADGDSLPDAWEKQYGLNPADNGSINFANGEYGDIDADGVPNLYEFINGTIPTQPNGEPGMLTRETWNHVSDGTIYSFEHSAAFLQTPKSRDTLTNWPTGARGDYYGERLRGTVTAPETGWYSFWITGDAECRLSLSTDSRKFQKRSIATVGDGNFTFAIQPTGNADNPAASVFPTQKSVPIHLIAGESYFLEVIHVEDDGNDSLSVGWKTPSGTPVPLPFSALLSFKYDLDDADDDDLPDPWESQYGLDPSDNGSRVTGREGALGDKDGDRLSNREEYLLGTHPNDADTDHDGLGDFTEIHDLGSDPKVAGSGLGVLLKDMAGSTGTSTKGKWIAGPDGSLLSLDRRGACTWPFVLSQGGIKILEVLAMAQGNTWAGNTLALDLAIIRPSDSKRWSAGTHPIADNFGKPCQVLAILPQLAAGSYLAEITVRNVSESRNVRIDRVRLLDAAGADANGNGIADWLEARVAQSNDVLTGSTSAVSPACIEGTARDVSMSWLQSGAVRTNLTAGIDNRWFANLALPANGTPLATTAWFEDGTYSKAAPISWVPTNVLEGGTITVRSGDSLRLTAHPGPTPDNGLVTITGSPATTANAPVIRTFEWSNWALASMGSIATQSGTAYGGVASRAIDGNVDGAYFGSNSVTHTNDAANSWWQVDLGQARALSRIVLWNRADPTFENRLSNFVITVRDANNVVIARYYFFPPATGFVVGSFAWDIPQVLQAKTIRVSLLGLNNALNGFLSLAEVQAFSPQQVTLNATHTNALGAVTTGSMNVKIVSADFGPGFPVRSGRWRDWLLSRVKTELPLEFDSKLKVTDNDYFGVHKVRLAALTDKPVNVIARSAVAASVAAAGTVDPYLIGDVYDSGYVEILETLPDGVIHGRISVVADRLPPGGYVELQIWAGGAQFANGASLKRLTAADFSANGVAYVDVYYPSQSALSSFCHYTRLYSADGTLLSAY